MIRIICICILINILQKDIEYGYTLRNRTRTVLHVQKLFPPKSLYFTELLYTVKHYQLWNGWPNDLPDLGKCYQITGMSKQTSTDFTKFQHAPYMHAHFFFLFIDLICNIDANANSKKKTTDF